jgi:cephalosporin-C deacetylase-like acetyl esterase
MEYVDDVTKIIVEGQSQGGGLGMVVSALDERKVFPEQSEFYSVAM